MASDTGSRGPNSALPPIAALFLVVFDRKVGYSIKWKRALPEVELDGVVEYKSLPSGLHNVEKDLVYFVHEQYAGISAFANHAAAESERNASFATVGVLVPLTYGRLGRSWLHAEQLRQLAEAVVSDTDDTDALQDYWDEHRISAEHAESSSLAAGSSGLDSRRKRRTLSNPVGFDPDGRTLSQDHPAMSMTHDLDTFGPLIFPLQRAALLKKRILVLSAAPVQLVCNFVYNLSVLSNIPHSVMEIAHTSSALHPVRPLFSVGVHDIAYLSRATGEPNDSWLACSTDDILGTKTQLYDVLVELPPPNSANPEAKQWPRIKTSDGQAIKATQRDLRRYQTLKRALHKMQRLQDAYHDGDDEQASVDNASESAPLNPTDLDRIYDEDDYVSFEGEAGLAEASSWAAIVYSSFLWWASAGEKDALLDDEALQDSRLLEDLPVPSHGEAVDSRPGSRSEGKRPSLNGGAPAPDVRSQAVAVTLIAYSHRLTTSIMETLAEIVEATEGESEGSEGRKPIVIGSEDLRRMGLDEWSQADGVFAQEMAALYFGREAEIHWRNIQCCGIKIC